MNRLAVYCGSSPGADPLFGETARALGGEMARRGIGLVYGGGRVGFGHFATFTPELVAREAARQAVAETTGWTRDAGFVDVPPDALLTVTEERQWWAGPIAAVISEAMNPGQIAFARTPFGPNCTASDFVKAITAPFEAV